MEEIYARNCNINIVDKTNEVEFLNNNHIQGYARSFISYGLFYKNELVQLLSFGKPRFNKNYQWEIIRDCTKKDYTVIGGTSKLWQHFLENNSVRSCVCYSYPHNGEYTNKYTQHCGFINIEKTKPQKKIYFEGEWGREIKRIDKSILEVHGVDRLLGGSFGHDRSNEQILIDLGFKKKYEDWYSPQIDSYFPCGIVYKITDLDTGKFYIGETTKVEEFANGIYNGSGANWAEYFNKYKDKHNFKREIIGDNFKTPKELFDAELREIRKYCKYTEEGAPYVDESTGCMNRKTCSQADLPVCPICGSRTRHKSDCILAKEIPDCPECGGKEGKHKKECSKFKQKICSECGGKGGHHLSTCSLFEQQTACPECGSLTTHKPTCSHYKEVSACPECGKKYGHKKSCSQYKAPDGCSECDLTYGHHKPTCSHYVKRQPCPHCGSYTTHKKDCPNYKKPEDLCPECGGYKNRHKTTCSHYDRSNICPECGGTYKHKKTCSHYKIVVCPECGGKNNRHYKTCSKYKKPKGCCPHCGTPAGGKHKKTCPDFVPMEKCEECGNSTTRHKPTCSQYKAKPACPECGSIGPRHKKTCSLYK